MMSPPQVFANPSVSPLRTPADVRRAGPQKGKHATLWPNNPIERRCGWSGRSSRGGRQRISKRSNDPERRRPGPRLRTEPDLAADHPGDPNLVRFGTPVRQHPERGVPSESGLGVRWRKRLQPSRRRIRASLEQRGDGLRDRTDRVAKLAFGPVVALGADPAVSSVVALGADPAFRPDVADPELATDADVAAEPQFVAGTQLPAQPQLPPDPYVGAQPSLVRVGAEPSRRIDHDQRQCWDCGVGRGRLTSTDDRAGTPSATTSTALPGYSLRSRVVPLLVPGDARADPGTAGRG
jgi:hypothetical protein